MLVDSMSVLEKIFPTPTLIATHCEDEETIKRGTSFIQMLMEML